MIRRALRRIRPIWVGPGNWIVARWGVEDRRAFGFWTLAFAISGTPIFGRAVLWVTILSVLALIPNVTSETPVELEREQ